MGQGGYLCPAGWQVQGEEGEHHGHLHHHPHHLPLLVLVALRLHARTPGCRHRTWSWYHEVSRAQVQWYVMIWPIVQGAGDCRGLTPLLAVTRWPFMEGHYRVTLEFTTTRTSLLHATASVYFVQLLIMQVQVHPRGTNKNISSKLPTIIIFLLLGDPSN